MRIEDREKAQRSLDQRTERGSGCWLWLGAIQSNGYGTLYIGGYQKVLAHRLAFEFARRPLRPGEEVHHDCGTKRCVNPEHLRAMGGTEHRRITTKEKCKRGHFLDARGDVRISSSGERICRPCIRETRKGWASG